MAERDSVCTEPSCPGGGHAQKQSTTVRDRHEGKMQTTSENFFTYNPTHMQSVIYINSLLFRSICSI